MSRAAGASCHGSGDPVGCRPCLSRRGVRRGHPAASPVAWPELGRNLM